MRNGVAALHAKSKHGVHNGRTMQFGHQQETLDGGVAESQTGVNKMNGPL